MGRLNKGPTIGYSFRIMSLYEVLVIVALAGVGLFAYSLYRSDMRRKPPGAEASEPEAAPARSMFGRDPPDRNGDGTGPSSRR